MDVGTTLKSRAKTAESVQPRIGALDDPTYFAKTAAVRWFAASVERDCQDLKQELGLGHYEGRGWRGFHHHAELAIAAYGFLLSERPAGP